MASDEEHQWALVEPVEPVQRRSSLGRNQRARPEIEEPGVEAPSPVERRPRKGQRVRSNDDEPARVDAPTDGVEAQAALTRLLARERLTLLRGEGGEVAIAVVHGDSLTGQCHSPHLVG